MPKDVENNETVNSANKDQEAGKLLELIPANEFEKLLVQLHEGEIDSEEFLGALFNGPLYVLTSADQIDEKKKKLKENPKLFTLFGDKKQPYLALFTDRGRAKPVMEKEERLNVLLKVPVGDLLAGAGGAGIIVNPFWDKHARWEPQQIGAFGSMMRREENGLWVRVPDEKLMTVFTDKGQPVKVEREKFRAEILPKQLEQVKNDASQLYNAVMSATNEGFAKDVVEAARELYKIDEIKERSTTALGITLLRAGEEDEAQELFEGYLSEQSSPVVMTNLAKVYEVKGDLEKRFELLEKALHMNPNMDSALDWYCHILDKEKGGKEAMLDALDELEGLAGSWKPALLLGRVKVIDGKVDEALEHYTDAMEVDGHSPDSLVFATSELGRMGHHEKVISFGLDHYDIRKDDPRAGFNILQACVVSKEVAKGIELCNRMSEIPVPEIQMTIEKFKEQLQAI